MGQLSADEIQVLNEALEDEYHAWSTYVQVLADFGEVRPFTRIREAEARHIAALLVLFDRYSLPVPPNRWSGKAERYPNLQAACAAAVEAEIANGQMYDRLLLLTQRADITGVLKNLQEASQLRHLPAFRRCLQAAAGERNDGGGAGGKGRRCRQRGI